VLIKAVCNLDSVYQYCVVTHNLYIIQFCEQGRLAY